MSSAGFTTTRVDWQRKAIPTTDVIGDLWRLIKLNGGALPSLQSAEQGSGRPEMPNAFPTVLIAAENSGMRQSMANDFRQDPCNVLHADSSTQLWDVIVNHSRPIHVLLAQSELVGPDFPKMAKQYRPGMQILFVADEADQNRPGILPVCAAARQARELLRSSEGGGSRRAR
jgi:hypothetical protein